MAKKKATPIPDFVVEYFLLGRTRQDATDRYTQDGGIVSDVWMQFARDRYKPQRVLVAPCREVPTVELGYALHHAITKYRSNPTWVPENRSPPNVSPLENFVGVTLHLDELVRVVLPFTAWWHLKNLNAIRSKAVDHGPHLQKKLERAILHKLGHQKDEIALRQTLPKLEESPVDRRVIEAAPLAALIGVFALTEQHPEVLRPLQKLHPKDRDFDRKFVTWVHKNAQAIARAVGAEFALQVQTSQPELWVQLSRSMQVQMTRSAEMEDAPELILRVFLDRSATLAEM
ncbi:MAG: hypothetical protein JNG86_14170, partial [Verrucomicrobiaceae bacterium]|nr:hypothetical protein [Verrucomicrobiaceae bacterium]